MIVEQLSLFDSTGTSPLPMGKRVERLFLRLKTGASELGLGERLCLVSVPTALPYRRDDGRVEWRHCTWWAVLLDHEAPSGWAAAALGLDDRWKGPFWHRLPWEDRL